MSRRPSIRVRWRKRGDGVVTHRSEGRGVEPHVTGRETGADEGGGGAWEWAAPAALQA